MSLQRYQYRLKTLSKLAMSPRDHEGLYLAAKEFKREDVIKHLSSESASDESDRANKVNIIYPFYQYGAYSPYNPIKAEYYIPGSSLKGALLPKGVNDTVKRSSKLMVDDIPVESKDVRLNQLNKLQNMSEGRTEPIVLKEFFPNVAVEILEAESDYTGELFYEGDLHTMLQAAQQQTMCKLAQFIDKLGVVSDEILVDDNTKQHVVQLKKNIQSLIDDDRDRCILLLGGYKGLALSGVFKNVKFGKVDSAVYVDTNKGLPYGMVEIVDCQEWSDPSANLKLT
ncbi:hypothetical protein [Paenibacillus sp. W2I17]|uniref:hypothetical protein n=1 Tax=Paenibacillus sp. W2I17 TaxID=3042311 RepID=UPI00278A975B|nr:hypothetical protein [Paenibacillus sp. W2I17]MDQ0659931.1 hypothetical protein [Paenibacillus sp. W2I17]